ncbi:helix-turn-helix transcriptional regulator [Listeria grandensis]|uniref:Helix-turn-helix transcriptional regulator n=1 Tax=Listeria grandensis TaxID=1494963 RepID=A0A7X0Y483_9LIST|nr:helix-turn-helix transcriptional regulator [Listeria grandensis]MBC1936702.1 helix-turn-helix transcriptional regulator [Listeria grandensis]
MMKTIGDTLKYIRSNKQYSQKNICVNTLSRTALSKIENNKLNPTYIKLSYILEKLDLDFEEFSYVQNNFKLNGKKKILNDFKKISSNSEVNAISTLMSSCQKYLNKEATDYIVSDIFLVLKSLSMLHSGLPMNDIIQTISPVWTRLARLDKWFLIEIHLINNLLFIFDISTAIPICKRALSELSKYDSQSGTLPIAFQLNLAYMLLVENDTTQAASYLNQTISLSKKQKRYDLLAVSQIRLGIATSPFNFMLINNGLSILTTIGVSSLEEQIKHEICTFTCPIKKAM